MPFLGAHMSIAGGLQLAIERGDSIGCSAIQIFIQSSRTWQLKPISEDTVYAFKKALNTAKYVKRVVAHNSYLLNLSTTQSEMREKSVGYFIQLMEYCERLGIESLITHPGSHLGAGENAGIEMTAKSINEVLRACKGFETSLLLENTAGQGGCIGHSFEQLLEIRRRTKQPERVFYCFDTQHAFAAGYDLRTEAGYENTFSCWDELLGLKNIKAFHMNDALKELGCRVDRHAAIGTGYLGHFPFSRLVNDNRFLDIPMCLETDPGENMGNYKRELKLLTKFIKSKKTKASSSRAPTQPPRRK